MAEQAQEVADRIKIINIDDGFNTKKVSLPGLGRHSVYIWTSPSILVNPQSKWIIAKEFDINGRGEFIEGGYLAALAIAVDRLKQHYGRERT